MPQALPNVDWDHLRALYCAGLSFKAIADKTGISHDAIRAHASRYGWKEGVTRAATVVQHAVTASLSERGKSWAGRIASILERHLQTIERMESEQDLDQLEKLVKIVRGLDDVGRRTFQLDAETSAGHLNGWAGRSVIIDVNPVSLAQLRNFGSTANG